MPQTLQVKGAEPPPPYGAEPQTPYMCSQLLDMALLIVHRLRGQDSRNRSYSTCMRQTDLEQAAEAIDM
eukprot:5947606-Amphidinium_carterae.1